MNRKGKGATAGVMISLGMFALVAILGLIAYQVFFVEKEAAVVNTGTQTGGITTTGACSSACPDTLSWAGTIDLKNTLNSTGAELFNAEMYFYESDGTLKTSITNGTGGSVTLTCGNTYTAKTVSASGAAGDSGYFDTGSGYTANADGSLTLTACGPGNKVTFNSNQHGLPEVRQKDLVADQWCHDNQDEGGSATDYESTDTVQFYSGTNYTAIAVGAGSELHIGQFVRAALDDNNFNDLGVYVLVDADSSVWDEPTVKLDGTLADEASGSLNSDEKIAYNAYEWVYFIPASRDITQKNEIEMELSMFALGGQNPTGAHNVSIDYAPVGRYVSTSDGSVIKVGAVKDDSSRSDVHTRFDTSVIVS